MASASSDFLTLQLIVVLVVDKAVRMDPLADVALLMGLLHVEEELILPKEILVAEPAEYTESGVAAVPWDLSCDA